MANETHLNWLPAPLWILWRDLTWARKKRSDWLAKLERYRIANPKFAENRVRLLMKGRPMDWDDNTPKEWAETVAKRWGLYV